MRLLLDTCTFLWIADGSPQLSKTARKLILDSDNDLFLSAASAWEIAVKFAAGRLSLPDPPELFVPSRRERNGIVLVPVDEAEALYVAKLPRHHNDPFDRMLVCQSILHGMAILTPDPLIAQYGVPIFW